MTHYVVYMAYVGYIGVTVLTIYTMSAGDILSPVRKSVTLRMGRVP